MPLGLDRTRRLVRLGFADYECAARRPYARHLHYTDSTVSLFPWTWWPALPLSRRITLSTSRPPTSSHDPPKPAEPAQTMKAEDPIDIDYDSLVVGAVAEPSPAEILEEKKRKRAAILARFSATNSDASTSSSARTAVRQLSSTPQPETPLPGSGPSTPGGRNLDAVIDKLKVQEATASGTASPESVKGEEEERDKRDLIDLSRTDGGDAQRAGGRDGDEGQEISAADYNPDDDDRYFGDEQKERERALLGVDVRKEDASKTEVVQGTGPNQGGALIGDEEDEDDEDDMFAISTKPKKSAASDADSAKAAPFVPIIDRSQAAGHTDASTLLVDNFDDHEGYYRVILGELLDNNRYHVHANLGKGMFSNVVRAREVVQPPPEGEKASSAETKTKEVAIKIVRSQESMSVLHPCCFTVSAASANIHFFDFRHRAGQKEALILRRIMEADPQDKKHLIRLERTFEHRGHLCLVFESLSMNLRDVVKRFGKDVGINLKAVRAYAHQIFLALNLLKKLSIMHADIKPDNILVSTLAIVTPLLIIRTTDWICTMI